MAGDNEYKGYEEMEDIKLALHSLRASMEKILCTQEKMLQVLERILWYEKQPVTARLILGKPVNQ